jgi:hypothetical protein
VLCGIVKRQFTKGFVFEPSPEEVRDTWLGKVEPVRIWLKSHAKRNVNAWVQRSDLFNAWESYRLANDLSKVTETRFVELVGQVVGGEKASIKQKGKTLRVYRNIESDIPGVIQASTVTQVTGFSDLLSIVENSIGEKYPQKAVTPVTENQKGAEP